MFAEDCVFHMTSGEFSLERMQQVSDAWFSAFPDLRGTLEALVAEGDMVVSHELWHATHLGELEGVAASGKQMILRAVSIVRILDGKIVEYWGVLDRLALMQQLGAAQPMGGGGG